MNTEVNNLLQSLKIQKIHPQAPQTAKPVEKGSQGAFASLLNKVTQDMEALKGETHEAKGRLDTGEIDQPEELEAAVKEAGRKYRSCVELSRNLIKAYKATIDSVKK
ncbi:MAG: flagellar hook-basal body complex protein FliE [Planctomycetota bacterium]